VEITLMRALQTLFEQDWLKGVLYTVIAIGTLALALGAWQFVAAEIGLRNNNAYQLRDEEITIETPTQQTLLFQSDVERRGLEAQRWSAIITGGAGLAVMAFGWMLLNVANDVRSRREGKITSAKPDAVT
jgi:hypothetical protein